MNLYQIFLLLQVNVCLECMNASLKTLRRRFIRCSAQATITHLKKFIAKKVLNGIEKYRDVSFFCLQKLFTSNLSPYCFYKKKYFNFQVTVIGKFCKKKKYCLILFHYLIEYILIKYLLSD